MKMRYVKLLLAVARSRPRARRCVRGAAHLVQLRIAKAAWAAPAATPVHGGKLQRRLPYFDRAKLPDKKVVVKTRFTRESLAKYFLLDLAVKDAVAKLKKIDAHREEDAAERKAD